MAYDPKDPADKKIVDGLIEAAIAEAEEAHEAAVTGLKKKNSDLLKKMKAGEGIDPEENSRLEAALEKAAADLKAANKALDKTTKERDTFKQTAETETVAARKLTIDTALNDALMENNIGKQYSPAVKKLLGERASVKTEGEARTVEIEGKPLGEFVKSWSQGDEGKHYVIAPANGGSGAPGGKANGSGKTVTKSAYEANPGAYAGFFKEGGTIIAG